MRAAACRTHLDGVPGRVVVLLDLSFGAAAKHVEDNLHADADHLGPGEAAGILWKR